MIKIKSRMSLWLMQALNVWLKTMRFIWAKVIGGTFRPDIQKFPFGNVEEI